MVALEAMAIAAFGATLGMLLNKIASKEFLDLFKKWKFNSDLLSKLKFLLLTVSVVLSDAEEKQISNPLVKEWLDELKDAVYDAEDVLDEIATEALHSQSENRARPIKNQQKKDVTAFKKRIESQVEEIIDRLKSIAQQKDVLGLTERLGGIQPLSFPSTSLVDKSEIFGREDDKNVILDFLLRTFDVINADEAPDSHGIEVQGSRVLHRPENEDGVPAGENGFKENDALHNGVYEKDFAAVGVPIPVVAVVGMPGVGKTTLAQLLFNDKNVFEIFTQRVWVHVSQEFDILKITKTIYQSVTSSCECQAADLNSLQVRLQEELRNKKFLLVLDDIWNENFLFWDVLQRPFRAAHSQSRIIVTTRSRNVALLMRAARIHHLSTLSHKDCWLLFAKHAFKPGMRPDYSDKQIREKIAQRCNGLPLAAKTIGSLLHAKAEIDEWYNVLNSEIWDLPSDKSHILPALRLSYSYLPSHLKRCFAYCSIFPKGYQFEKAHLILLWMAEGLLLQSRSKKRLEDVGDEYFHELLSRSFFQPVTRPDKPYFIMHELFSDLARSVAGEFCFKSEDGILHQVPEKVRYFSIIASKLDDVEKFDALQGANHLRTFLPLKPHYAQGACVLSSSALANLLQAFSRLRALSLRHYNFVKLHDSIGNLKYLRYLDISGSGIKELPKSVCSLYNLETLLLAGCRQLIKLPENTKNLISLQHLDISGTKIMEMPPQFGRLKSLHVLKAFVVGDGHSSISELKELSNLQTLSIMRLEKVHDGDALAANLKQKKYLSELVLQWTPGAYAQKDTDATLDQLQPYKNLKKLTVQNFGGRNFPSWLGNASLSKLVSLHIVGCGNCSSILLPLRRLFSLKELRLAKMEKLTTLDFGFCSVETLKFDDCSSLETLEIRDCPCLTFSPGEQLRTPNLKLLSVSKCKSMVSMPEQMHRLTSLQELTISECALQSFPKGGLPANLKSFSIKNCKNQLTPQAGWGLHNMASLTCFEIEGECKGLESFPAKGLLPASLTSVTVTGFQDLRTLNLTGFRDLKCLKYLDIRDCNNLDSISGDKLPVSLDCNNLHSISGDKLPVSLDCLNIIDCPLMKKRCQKGGDDWNKISHISDINIE